MSAAAYYIASLKHTGASDEHITFWGPDWRGYTCVIGEYIGEYPEAEAAKLNDGIDFIAVPADVVKALCSPEPYFRPAAPARFYDQRGPVVDNGRSQWDRLIAMSLANGSRTKKVKPEVFRGTRRSFAHKE